MQTNSQTAFEVMNGIYINHLYGCQFCTNLMQLLILRSVFCADFEDSLQYLLVSECDTFNYLTLISSKAENYHFYESIVIKLDYKLQNNTIYSNE